MLERFSTDARETVVAAREQASLLRHNFIGCEHLLLALANRENSQAADAIAACGLDQARLREEVAKLAGGRGGTLDAQALSSLGIDLDEVRRAVEASFGPGALDRTRAGRPPFGRIPFTPPAKKTLEIALRTAVGAGEKTISTGHLLLGLLNQRDNAALRVLTDAGVPPDALRQELARRMDAAA